MHRIRKTIVVASLTALAIAALAAPSSAIVGKGTIGIVNGIPGTKVDICINGKEIRSNVDYGGRAFRTMDSGIKSIKVYKQHEGKCKGVKVAQTVIDLGAFADWTLVVNKEAPKVIKFDNAGLGTIPPDGTPIPAAIFTWRHAADLGAVNFHYRAWMAIPEMPVGPAANPLWHEGDQIYSGTSPGSILQLRITRPDQDKTLAIKKVTLKESRRYEWYLLGTKAKNARLVIWERAISEPAP